MPAIVVNLDHPEKPYPFYCFACGTQIHDENLEVNENHCEHLMFTWMSEIGTFEAVHPVMLESIDGLAKFQEDEWHPVSDPLDKKFQAACPDQTVLFMVSDRGGLTMVVGVRFSADELA